MAMDSEALLTFVTVARAGGFSAAAETLLRTQPAISRRVALLEAELGAALFDRTPGGVLLSEAGRALLPHAERVLAALDDAANAMADLDARPSGRLSLAVVGTLAGAELTRPLKAFARRFPDVRVDLRTAASAEVSDLVRRGEATLGLRYFNDPSGDLVSLPLGREPLLVACAADHRLAGRRVASLTDLKDESWFAFPNAFAWREANAANLFAQFLARGVGEIAWSGVDSLTAQKRLIEAGFGLALLPVGSVAEERAAGSLAVIEVADLDVANPVTAVFRKGGYLSRGSQALLEMLQGAFGPAEARRGSEPAGARRRNRRASPASRTKSRWTIV